METGPGDLSTQGKGRFRPWRGPAGRRSCLKTALYQADGAGALVLCPAWATAAGKGRPGRLYGSYVALACLLLGRSAGAWPCWWLSCCGCLDSCSWGRCRHSSWLRSSGGACPPVAQMGPAQPANTVPSLADSMSAGNSCVKSSNGRDSTEKLRTTFWARWW